jgi:hypothetical protein
VERKTWKMREGRARGPDTQKALGTSSFLRFRLFPVCEIESEKKCVCLFVCETESVYTHNGEHIRTPMTSIGSTAQET